MQRACLLAAVLVIGFIGTTCPKALADGAIITAPPEFTAYELPAPLAGNQNFGGSLGHSFDVVSDIEVTQLGVFDDNGDGLNLTIDAHIYDRNAAATPVASLQFTPGDPGTLVGGQRFKTLASPLVLPAGFQGMVVGEGYGGTERNRNGGAPHGPVNDGGGLITFGPGYWGTAGLLLVNPDGSGFRFGAGTFAFQEFVPPPPPPPPLAPEPSTFVLSSVLLALLSGYYWHRRRQGVETS